MIEQLLCAVLFLSPCTVQPDDAARWPQFLGPRGTALTESRPASLSFDKEKGVLWHVSLPSGSSSPCIWDELLFVTGQEGDELLMIALDRNTGAERWRRGVKAPKTAPFDHVDAEYAAPTACTDGKLVFFYFGSYGLIACTLDGEAVWEKRLPVPDATFGIGSSPILVDDLVILNRDGCPDSGIYAFAKSDGAPRWRVPRLEFTFSFGTPYIWQNAGRRELVVAGTHRLTSLDPESGRELWRVDGLSGFICTTPTSDADTLYFGAWSPSSAAPADRTLTAFGYTDLAPEEVSDSRTLFARLDTNGDGVLRREELPASRLKDAFAFVDQEDDGMITFEELSPLLDSPKGRGNNLLVAVRAGGAGDVSETHVRWSRRRGLPYVCSPLLHEGRLYLMKSGGLLTCLEPRTGEPHFDRHRLDDRSEYYASPVGVPGHVILCSTEGTIYVLRTGDEFDLVARVALGESIKATPAVVDGTIYVRSDGGLRAFGRE